MSPLATTLPQAYTLAAPVQASNESTGLTPFVNFADSPSVGQITHTSPPQMDTLFSGIDFSEVSEHMPFDVADSSSLCCNHGLPIV
jgi:hypothetical protein